MTVVDIYTVLAMSENLSRMERKGILLEAWKKQQSLPKMEQSVELALPFPQLMLLHFSLYILKCSLQLDFKQLKEWHVCNFLT